MMIPLEPYLRILANADADDNPWAGEPELSAVGEAFVPLAHALANFVRVAKATPGMGYEAAIANLESVIHGFPSPASVAREEQADKLREAAKQRVSADEAEALIDKFAKALAAAPETDHPLGNYEDDAMGQGRAND